jgi:glycosyltransferase involved in cell wall biosynthesis
VKVAYIVGGLPFGGIERWLYDLCLEYRKNGLLRPRVFNISGAGELLPTYLDAGLEVESIADGKRALATWRFDTTRKLRKALRKFVPDIIHTMHFTANYHGRLAAAGLGAPVLVHLRNIKHERRPFRRFADKALSRLTTEYLAVSRAVAAVVQSDHNRAGRPVQVLYNAIVPDRLGHGPADLKALYGLEPPVVVSVGRYVPQKNLDLLLRAVALLRDGGRSVSLVMVGEGGERSRLEALRAELRLTDRAVLTGFRSDVPAFLKAADIFAMPSDFEGLPIAHLEAMACGLPAVLSEQVPSLEIAADACLVCQRTPEDIAAKIGLLLSDAELRGRLSKRALAVAGEHTMSRYAFSLYEVYRAVIARKAFARSL